MQTVYNFGLSKLHYVLKKPHLSHCYTEVKINETCQDILN